MNPIPIIWQKRLSWVPYFNWFFIFVRLFRPMKAKPTWGAAMKAYVKECMLLVLSWAVLAIPVNLLKLLIPWALKGMVLLMAWLLPVIYVRVSIRAQETPGWWQY